MIENIVSSTGFLHHFANCFNLSVHSKLLSWFNKQVMKLLSDIQKMGPFKTNMSPYCDLVHWVHHSWQKIKPFLSLFTLLTFDSHDEIGTHQTCCSSNTVLLSCQAQPYQLLTTYSTHMHWGQPIFWSAAPYLGWVGFVKDLFVSICTQLYISQ